MTGGGTGASAPERSGGMRGTDIAATAEERRRPFPGDGLVEEPLATWTHGVTIAG